ncbi:hypothetical protein BJ165DRAFT_1532162 [Panaeolus papilionaceus]|nr:hypothetical protein BJ165DRAFT_1532162 [Panaeolus papilionaceus]
MSLPSLDSLFDVLIEKVFVSNQVTEAVITKRKNQQPIRALDPRAPPVELIPPITTLSLPKSPEMQVTKYSMPKTPQRSQPNVRVEVVDGRWVYHARPRTPRTPQPRNYWTQIALNLTVDNFTPVQKTTGGHKLPQIQLNEAPRSVGPMRTKQAAKKIKGRRSTPYPRNPYATVSRD